MRRICVLFLLVFLFSVAGCSAKSQQQRNLEVVRTVMLLEECGQKLQNRDFSGLLESADEGLKLDSINSNFYANRAVALYNLGDKAEAQRSIDKAVQLFDSGRASELSNGIKTQQDRQLFHNFQMGLHMWEAVIHSNIVPYNLLSKQEKESFPIGVSDVYVALGVVENPTVEAPGMTTSFIYAESGVLSLDSFIMITQTQLSGNYYIKKDVAERSEKKKIKLSEYPALMDKLRGVLGSQLNAEYVLDVRSRVVSSQKSLSISFFSSADNSMSEMSFDELLHTFITKYPPAFDRS